MSDCDRLCDDLKAYLDGELPAWRRLTVRRHLVRCESCREEVQVMEWIGNDLRAGDEGVLDPALRAKILAGLPEGEKVTG